MYSPAGTWRAGEDRLECTKCGPGQTSSPGAPSADYCFCANGDSPNGGKCQLWCAPCWLVPTSACLHALQMLDYTSCLTVLTI
jgi:hypothetical protein